MIKGKGIHVNVKVCYFTSGIERLQRIPAQRHMPEGRVGKMSAFVRTSNGFSLITRNKDTGHELMSCNSMKSFEV